MASHREPPQTGLFITWLITVTICVAAVLADRFFDAPGARFAGVQLSSAIAGAMYLAVAAVLIASFRWLRILRPKPTRFISVRDLREPVGRP